MKHDTPPTSSKNRDSTLGRFNGQQRLPRGYVFLLASLVLIGGAWAFRALTSPATIVGTSVTGADRVPAPAFLGEEEIDRLITAYEERITEHTDSSDYRILGSLYLEKGRLTGDVSRYLAAAEAYATASELVPSDPVAIVGRASAAYAIHDFEIAADQSRRVYEATGRVDSLAVLFDATVALGDYESASALLETLEQTVVDSPAVMVRTAEWSRLTGDPRLARSLSLEAAASTGESPNARLRSWYATFAAQMMLELGDYETGLELAQEAIDDDPRSRLASITRARLLAAVGKTEDAIGVYREVTVATPEPEVLAELGSLLLLVGDPEEAEDTFATLEVVADLSEAQGVYDRAIAQHLADHRFDPDRAVKIARSELESRDDVGAYDTLAWALYTAGQIDESSDAMARALSLGTVDAEFLYHAGMIAAAMGDQAAAVRHLEDALALSPGFDPLQSERALVTLEELR